MIFLPRRLVSVLIEILRAHAMGAGRRGLSYRDLVERLATVGVQETERNLNNKISRGGFSAAFLIQCLDAIGCDMLLLSR
jgi:Domain of unknown function (DUF6471)